MEPRFVSQVLLLCTGDKLTLKKRLLSVSMMCTGSWGGVEEHACMAWRSEDHREQLWSRLSLPPWGQGVESESAARLAHCVSDFPPSSLSCSHLHLSFHFFSHLHPVDSWLLIAYVGCSSPLPCPSVWSKLRLCLLSPVEVFVFGRWWWGFKYCLKCILPAHMPLYHMGACYCSLRDVCVF